MKWELTTSPVEQPVSYATAKSHLRLPNDADEEYVSLLIEAATDYAEVKMSASLVEREITATFYDGDIGTDNVIRLPYGPVAAITSVFADQLEVTDYEQFRVGNSDRLKFTVTPSAPVVVIYDAGYGSASDVPAMIRQAILTHVGTLYEHRESVSAGSLVPVPHSLESFYSLKSRTVVVA